MVGAFSRSWQITKLSFGVIKSDKELLLYPIFSFIFSLIYMIALLFPRIILAIINGTFEFSGLVILDYILLFVTYFGTAFIATFFNVCVVYTAKRRFAGENARFFGAIGFAFSRFFRIAQWSFVAASVGVILYMLDQLAEKLGPVGGTLLKILRNLLSMAWGIVTIFIVPGIVYYNLSPGAAIKKSIATLKKTWGESLIRHFGLGLAQFVVTLLVILIFGAITVALFIFFSVLGLLIGLGVLIIALIITFLVFGVAHQVFNVALFEYADKGKVPKGYTKDVMKEAFKVKQ